MGEQALHFELAEAVLSRYFQQGSNVRLAGDHLYGKLLFTWLSLVMSMMVSYFVLSFFPLGVLDEILNLIESVSEVFSSYSFKTTVASGKFAPFATCLNCW